ELPLRGLAQTSVGRIRLVPKDGGQVKRRVGHMTSQHLVIVGYQRDIWIRFRVTSVDGGLVLAVLVICRRGLFSFGQDPVPLLQLPREHPLCNPYLNTDVVGDVLADRD